MNNLGGSLQPSLASSIFRGITRTWNQCGQQSTQQPYVSGPEIQSRVRGAVNYESSQDRTSDLFEDSHNDIMVLRAEMDKQVNAEQWVAGSTLEQRQQFLATLTSTPDINIT
jgi:hypothetical protein